MKVLHIVNGDATAHVMERSGIEGDVAVWREMLCEGPTTFPVGDDGFWDVRSKHFAAEYDITSYEEHVRPQFDIIAKHTEYEETILWFEYDLFCQLNMIALLHYLRQTKLPGQKISLVCVGKQRGSDKMLCLGEIDPMEYKGLMFVRTPMDDASLHYAATAWEAYCSGDMAKLLPFIYQASNPNFEYLGDALSMQLKRFPSTTNGLNHIEQAMLEMVDQQELTEGKLVRELLQWQQWYGFGDMQYFHYLSQMNELIDKDGETLKLTSLGKQVLEASSDVHIIQATTIYGGALKNDYWFDPEFGIVNAD